MSVLTEAFSTITESLAAKPSDKFVLYSYYRSSTSYRVRIALNLKHIQYDVVPINLLKNEHNTNSEYIKLNTQHVVPTLKHNDTVLVQSIAIIEYLNELYPYTVPLLPSDTVQRAHCRAIVGIIASDTSPVANMNVLQSVDKLGGSDAKTQWIHNTIRKGLLAVEKYIQNLSDGHHCITQQVTIADVCLVPQVYNALRFNVDLSDCPTVMNIYNYLTKLPEFICASPEKQIDCPST